VCADFPNVVAQRHIWGLQTQGPMTPKFERRRDFLTVDLAPKFHHPTFTRSEVIALTTTHTHNQKSFTSVFSPPLRWTSLPKVIWGKGRVAALSHTYAVKSPLVTMARPKSTPSRGPIPKPHYLPHPWTRRTYDTKWHQDPIRRFSTMHWTDRPTHRPTDHPRESLMTTGRCSTRATRPNNI